VELNLSRSISLLNQQKVGAWFGEAVADTIEQEDTSFVAFRTKNTVRAHESASIACRQRGMFNTNPKAFVIVSISEPVEINYLGGAPHGRIRHLPQALLFRVDGHRQCQMMMPYSASPPILGAIELQFGTLTLWAFDMPGESEEDMIRIYNSSSIPGAWDGPMYYEVNCFSGAKKLQPDECLVYGQCTLHLSADNETLDGLIRCVFDVSLQEIQGRM